MRHLCLLLITLLVAPLAAQAPLSPITFVTDPPGARIYLQVSGRSRYEKYLGLSGQPVYLDRSRLPGLASFQVRFRLDGYQDHTETVGIEFSGRWPATGAIRLAPLSIWARVRDLARSPVGVLALVLTVGGALGLLWREREVARRLRRLDRLEQLGSADRPCGLGPWRLLEVLGRGGAATVYRAVAQDSLDVKEAVAVKVLGAAGSEQARARFQRELKMLSQLSHPQVVRIIDHGEADGELYLAMELMPGGSLRERMRGPLGVTESVAYLEAILTALDYLHGQGVVHRDLKPENILLTARGKLKLADFGLVGGLEQLPLTADGQLLGTPAYMPPESLLEGGHQAPGDLYAVGVIAYELLSGRPPFGSGGMRLLLAQSRAQAPPLEGVPEPLSDWVARLLRPNPEERFASAREALEHLQTAVR